MVRARAGRPPAGAPFTARGGAPAVMLNAMKLPRGPGTDTITSRFGAPMGGYALALLALLASLLLVLLYWHSAQQREQSAARAQFEAETEVIAELLKQRLNNYELVARGGVSLFGSVDRPSSQQWRSYVDGLDIATRYPDMIGLGYAPRLNRMELQELQIELRDAGKGFYVLRPAGVRAEYGPILYLEPGSPDNRAAIGHDMFAEPVRQAAMVAARDDGQTRISGRVQLRDAGRPVPGLVMYAPVYRMVAPATVLARRAALQGWVHLSLQLESFVASALRMAPRQIALTIRDVGNDDAPGQVLYADPVPRAGEDGLFARSMALDLYGRRWQLDFSADMAARLAERTSEVRMTLGAGLIASLLLFGIALALARTESLAEQKAARLSESFQRSELRFRNAMRFSAIGMALLDRSGAIVDANPALAEIFDTSTDALVGTALDSHFIDVHDPGGSPVVTPPADGVYRTTRRWRLPDGEVRHVQVAYAPVPGDIGQDVANLVQVEDITERVRAEERARVLHRTLEARVAVRTRELTQANHELETFAYSVSHDLRAPLRTIEGFGRLLAERHADVIDEEGMGYLARVRNAAGRMDELIGALLKMSRVSRGPLTLVQLDLERIAREVVAELGAAQPQRQVEVTIEPGLHAVGDVALVRNLMQNLIGNAWKFTAATPDARITIGKEDGKDGQPTFFVRDNGAGFASEYTGKLFRPFQRLHSQEAFAGHGIGLATVKRIVERHGGTISAEGRSGEGATFRFTLPEGQGLGAGD